MEQQTDVEGRVWLITGSSSGFGRALAEAVLERGDRVVATARNTAAIADLAGASSQRCRTLQLDVTQPAQARAAVEEAVAVFGRIDVVVNNAGYGLAGALEEFSDEELRRQFDVNVFGVLNVTRATLPQFRRQRYGHIVQISSVSGVAPALGVGESAYAGTKFALEGISEALAKEVAHLGIQVTIVEPGSFRTDFAGRSIVLAEPMEEYADSVGQIRKLLGQINGTQAGDPARAAQAIIAAVDAENPPLRLPLGQDALDAIRAKLDQQRRELDAWAHLGASTDFAD